MNCTFTGYGGFAQVDSRLDNVYPPWGCSGETRRSPIRGRRFESCPSFYDRADIGPIVKRTRQESNPRPCDRGRLSHHSAKPGSAPWVWTFRVWADPPVTSTCTVCRHSLVGCCTLPALCFMFYLDPSKECGCSTPGVCSRIE